MSELKPCPFCGGPSLLRGAEAFGYFVSCETSGCYGFNNAKWSRDDAIETYNRRTPQPVTPAGGEVEARAKAMFEAGTVGANSAPWEQQWEPTKEYWRAKAAHPPVADAAPPKLGLSADEILHITSGLPSKWRRWADGLRGIQAANRIRDCADDLDAALNQRGGGCG